MRLYWGAGWGPRGPVAGRGSVDLRLLPGPLPSQAAVGCGPSAALGQGGCRVRSLDAIGDLSERSTLAPAQPEWRRSSRVLELGVRHKALLPSDACWRLQPAALNFTEKFSCPIGDLKSD